MRERKEKKMVLEKKIRRYIFFVFRAATGVRPVKVRYLHVNALFKSWDSFICFIKFENYFLEKLEIDEIIWCKNICVRLNFSMIFSFLKILILLCRTFKKRKIKCFVNFEINFLFVEICNFFFHSPLISF